MKNLKSSIILRTKNGNRYLFDKKTGKTLLCHPLLDYLARLNNDGMDLETYISELQGDPIEIEDLGQYGKEEIEYYYQKYRLLKKNGYFGEIDNNFRLDGELTVEHIKNIIANVGQITFEVTDKCNLRCEYCAFGKFYTDYDKREDKNIDIRAAKKLLDYLDKLWNSSLHTSHNQTVSIGFYGGEPLMNFPFIREITKYVNHLKAGINRFIFSMTTNGLLLAKHMDFLVAHDFSLVISLDGNKTNNSYRVFPDGKEAYDHILKNVKTLQKEYPEYFESKVSFNSVLHNRNSVSDIHQYFKEHFNKIPFIAELSTSGIKDSQKEYFWKTYSNIHESLYKNEDYSLIEKDMFINLPNINGISKFIHQCTDFSFDDYTDMLYPDMKHKKIPTATCLPFSKRIFVTVNGRILPCEKIGHQYYLGNVTPESVELNFEKIVRRYNAYYKKIRKQCRACYNSEVCGECFFHLNIDSEGPKCRGFMTYKDFSKYLSSQISHIEKNPEIYTKILREVTYE